VPKTATTAHPTKQHRLMRAATVLILGLSTALLAGTWAVPGQLSAQAAPGTPGTPQPGTGVFSEDFQNATRSPVQTLTTYTGTNGQKYTAAAGWLQGCNGWIASAAQSTTASGPVADCTGTNATAAQGQAAWNGAQQLAQALGLYRGATAAASVNNYADTAYTSTAPGAGAVEFQTASNVPFSGSNRFIAFSVDVAAANCATASHPLLQFRLLNDAGTAINAGSQIDACSSPTTRAVPTLGSAPARTVNVGTYTSDGAVLFSGTSVGVRMVNNNGAAGGNDHAIDNVQILDVTPQLDKAFSPTSVVTGGTSTLTFTITNTAELAAKNGWSFTDTLPASLTLASPAAAATTCPAGTVNAAAGAGSVAVTGNLTAGMSSCTVTVNVTSQTAGTYINGPTNVTTVGLNPPADAQITFARPAITIIKTAGTPTDVNNDGLTNVGDTIPYRFTVTNTGDVPLSAVVVNDPKVTDVTCPSAVLAVSAAETCTASYIVTTADFAAGAVENTATATGTPPTGSPVTSSPSSTTTPLEGAGITVVKRLPVRAAANDQFTVAVRSATGDTVTSATTAGEATSTTSPAAPLALNQTYTITDTLASGPAAEQDRYVGSLSCTNSSTGVATPISGAGPEWTFTPTDRVGYMCTVTNRARTTLTLVKDVSAGTLPASTWTLSGTADAPAIAGPRGVTGTDAASADVTPGVPYTLAETGGPDTYTQQGAWACHDATSSTIPVNGATVTIPDGTDVTCTITNATARLVLLKHVVSPSLDPADWLLTATPEPGFTLDLDQARGAEQPASANTFEVRPDHPYAIAETPAPGAAAIAFRQIAIQQLVDGTWTDVDANDGIATVHVAAGQTATYRFVNDTVPAVALPLTGGLGTDRVLIIGGALATLALILALIRHIATTRLPRLQPSTSAPTRRTRARQLIGSLLHDRETNNP
jgi:uncharacterized repeat protein (TIGR01451 family)